MSVGTYFAPLVPSLSDLGEEVLEDINQVVLSVRDGVESVCAVTPSLETLAAIIGEVPVEIQEATTSRYGVDLESIGSDKVRLYVDSPELPEILIGYYFSSDNAVVQKKIYKRPTVESTDILVDRFDAEGTLISYNEPESPCKRRHWQGRGDLADRADRSPYLVAYLKKGAAPQSYISVLEVPT